MKLKQSQIGPTTSIKDLAAKAVSDLFSDKLTVKEQIINIPPESELKYKIKYHARKKYSTLTISVSWNNPVQEPAEEKKLA